MIDGNGLIEHIKQNIGIGLGETTNDHVFSVEASECIGHCDEAPVIMINDKVYKGLDSEKIKEIFQGIKSNQ
jgi:NADH:ubiquinone oxidoreductase subunit E